MAQPIKSSFEWAWFALYTFASICTFILLIIHSWAVISDLCTSARKSVSHLRHQPAITINYKLMEYLTLCCVFMNFANAITVNVQMTDITKSQCLTSFMVWMFPLMFSKGSMYCIILFRSYGVFGRSIDGYPRKFVFGALVFVVVFSIILPIIAVILISQYNNVVQDINGFPNPCYSLPVGPVIDIPIIVMIYDIFMNSACIALFVMSFKKLMKSLPELSDSIDPTKARNKLMYVGVKYTILTCVAAVATFIAILIVVVPFMPFIQSLDVVVNSICVMLMTSYYPDNNYYEKLCKCCLLCCPAKYRYDGKSRENMTIMGHIIKLDDKSHTAVGNEIATATTIGSNCDINQDQQVNDDDNEQL